MTNTDEQNKVLNLYPIDYPFETLVDRVSKKKLKLNADFQRKYKWDKDGHKRGSRFIESCLMRIPLPACYFAESLNEKGEVVHEVIDGVQRITTIQKFFNNEFALEDMGVFKELEGKTFNELDDFRNELENTTIRCVILRKENPKRLVNEIFARLNQGAVKLEPQEIRHAVYPGAFDRLLQDLAKNDVIKNFKIKKAINDEETSQEKDGRENEELILRYFALQSNLEDYDNNLTRYLDKYMEQKQNISEIEVEELREDFNKTLSKCLKVFTVDEIFRDTTNNKPKHGLIYYDLLMWYFRQLPDVLVEEKKDTIKDSFNVFCKLPKFQVIKTGGLQKKESILKRRKLLKETLGLLDEQYNPS